MQEIAEKIYRYISVKSYTVLVACVVFSLYTATVSQHDNLLCSLLSCGSMPPEMQVAIKHAHRVLFCPWPFFCFKKEPRKHSYSIKPIPPLPFPCRIRISRKLEKAGTLYNTLLMVLYTQQLFQITHMHNIVQTSTCHSVGGFNCKR